MKFFNILRWTTAWTATWTLLMTPVALGQEAKRVSKQQMQTVVDQLGLNKQITLGEFYTKNKHLFPPRVQKEIEPLLMAFKNQQMPTIEVLSSKTTTGEEIATVRVSQGTELINIQWFGESEKMFKFQNTNISEIDVVNFSDMFTRIFAGDEKFRKQIAAKPSKSASSSAFSSVFSKEVSPAKYPDISKAEWQSMSVYDRANYVVNLRLLWQDSHQVLKAKEALKKNPKSSEYFFEKNKYFFELFFGQKVEAAPLANKPKKPKGPAKKAATNVSPGKSCIVAGYVAQYANAGSVQACSDKVVDSAYNNKENSLYLKAKAVCLTKSGGRDIACNPYIFGTPNGSPTCVTPALSNSSFQQATHWDGPCDRVSRMSKNEVEILKDKTKKLGRYEDGNLMPEAEREKLFKTEQGAENYKLTEDYLLGILKFRGHIKSDTKSLFDKNVMSDEILEQIVKDKKVFDLEIAEATKSCKLESEASKSSKRNYESNYWQACDQLHRRYAFVNELFASKCGKGDTYNPITLKCTCALKPPAQSPAPTIPPVDDVAPGSPGTPPSSSQPPVHTPVLPPAQPSPHVPGAPSNPPSTPTKPPAQTPAPTIPPVDDAAPGSPGTPPPSTQPPVHTPVSPPAQPSPHVPGAPSNPPSTPNKPPAPPVDDAAPGSPGAPGTTPSKPGAPITQPTKPGTPPSSSQPPVHTPTNPPAQQPPPVEVCPGAKCDINPKPSPNDPVENCESLYPGATDLSNKCLCPNGKAPNRDIADEISGQEIWSCHATSGNKTAVTKDECGFGCKLWKGLKIMTPVLIAGFVAFAVFKSLAPKKPALRAPPDICPNTGLPAPCAQICRPPLKNQANGTCGCEGCPPGQTANSVTCFCSTSMGMGPTQTIICPDGVTSVADLVNCPVYACWNGQSYQNPMNCPPQIPKISPAGVTQ